MRFLMVLGLILGSSTVLSTVFAAPKERLVIVGASHSLEGFGAYFDQNLQTDFEVARYAAGGSNSGHWVDGWIAPYGYYERDLIGNYREYRWDSGVKVELPIMSTILERNKPSVVVVALGTNELWFLPHDPEKVLSNIQKMVKTINEYATAPKCVWIAPPGFKANNNNHFTAAQLDLFYKLLKTIEGQCTVFYGSKNFVANSADGIHFVPNSLAAYNWAQAAGQFVRSSVLKTIPKIKKPSVY